MSQRRWTLGTPLSLAALLAVGLQGLIPNNGHAAPALQGIPVTEEERWQAAQETEQRAAERVRAWPQAYPVPNQRARPPYPGSTWQQPYPWELLGSPYLPVIPLREINFMGVPPDRDDPCYGRLMRLYATPVAFRLNYLEASRYLEQGAGPVVLDAWASYLGRLGTLPGAVQSPDDVVAMGDGCYGLPLPADDATLSPVPEGSQRHECGELRRPADARFLTAQNITNTVAGWLAQCGYLTDGLLPPLR